MKKLIISTDGSEPEAYAGASLIECLAGFLGSIPDLSDDCVDVVLEDLLTFVSHEADESGRIKAKFVTGMWYTAEWCYGYDSHEEAFDECFE